MERGTRDGLVGVPVSVLSLHFPFGEKVLSLDSTGAMRREGGRLGWRDERRGEERRGVEGQDRWREVVAGGISERLAEIA